jgi:hypothetical protein
MNRPLAYGMSQPLVGGLIGGRGGAVEAGPVNTVAAALTLTGTGEPGDSLSWTDGTWTTLGTISSTSYSLRLNGVEVDTGPTPHTILDDAQGSYLVRVTKIDQFGSQTRGSNNIVIEFTPVELVPAVIDFDLDAPFLPYRVSAATFDYALSTSIQWYRNDVLVSGQTSAAYSGAAANGDTFVLKTTAVNGGKSLTVGSNEENYSDGTVVPMPSGALGVYYVGDYDPDLVAIPNAASAEPLSENVLRWPKRFISTFWGGDGVTASYVNDSGGNLRARRITSAGASLARYVTVGDASIPAGSTWTLVVKCKSATPGVSQNVPLGGYFPVSTGIYAVGDSWTRVAHTFTNGGGNTSFAVGVCDMAGGNAFSIDIESIEMFPGSVDPGDDGNPGHLYIGRFGGNPGHVTVAAGALTYATSSSFGFITFPGDTQSADVTYLALMRRPSTLTGTEKRCAIFETLSDFNVHPHFEMSGVPAIKDGIPFNQGGVDPERGWDFISLGWQCMIIRMSATGATLFLNGRPVRKITGAYGSLDINTLLHGCFFASSSAYNHAVTAIWDRALTDSEAATATEVAVARAVADGITMGPTPNLIVMEGDSKVSEDVYDYGWKLEPLLAAPSIVSIYAAGGSNLGGSLESRKATITGLYSADRPFTLCVDIGTNDLHGGISGASFITAYKSYLSSIRSAVPNIKIVVIPLLSKSTLVGGFVEDTAFTAQRNILNADIPSWVGSGHIDAFLNLTGKAYFADNACTNAAYLEDGWHHSPATSADIAAELAALIDSL